MNQVEFDQRLSKIATLWTAVFQAHGAVADNVVSVRNRLMLRYSGAVYRYLLGAVRDPEVASDLCQEFAVRFLRGDFHRATPERGRFRDYLKTALINLVNDHFRQQKAAPRGLEIDAAAPTDMSADTFEGSLRTEFLEQTWKALADANPTFHATLRLRIAEPDLPSGEAAERLSQKLGKPISAENVRKTVQRARAKFAELLLDLVAESLEHPSHEELESELKSLDLLRYCQSILESRRPDAKVL